MWWFVTLYDTDNRIPVFSAGRFKGTDGGKRPKTPWNIEPQLLQLPELMSNMWNDEVFKFQATNTDYFTNQSYNRGHLFPCCYGYNNDDRTSTFTLTNIVPQRISFNNGSWKNMETCVKCLMEKFCKNNNDVPEAFVVTGAKPGPDKLNRRVNIPSKLWSAFCCYSPDKTKWLASAYWGENIDPTSKYLETKTLDELRQQLGFEAFPSNTPCPAHETVAELYPKIRQTDLKDSCKCPPAPPTSSAPTTTTSTSSAPSTTTSTSSFLFIGLLFIGSLQ